MVVISVSLPAKDLETFDAIVPAVVAHEGSEILVVLSGIRMLRS